MFACEAANTVIFDNETLSLPCDREASVTLLLAADPAYDAGGPSMWLLCDGHAAQARVTARVLDEEPVH
jgi:hypothetical protein